MCGQPFWFFMSSVFGMNIRCEMSSSHEKAKPGRRDGCNAMNAAAKAARASSLPGPAAAGPKGNEVSPFSIYEEPLKPTKRLGTFGAPGSPDGLDALG